MTEQRAWAACVTMLASDNELDAVVDRIGAVICSPPDHPGPCAHPWSIVPIPVDDLDEPERSAWPPSVDELIEQRTATGSNGGSTLFAACEGTTRNAFAARRVPV